ncbi:MAG: efflux RND transporter periplasmic adaptor subunit [Pseudomonadota bacterium]
MNDKIKFALGGLLLALVAFGGYWYGKSSTESEVPSAENKAERTLLYYRNPMGLPDTSPVPKKDSMGMDYIPVYAGEETEDKEGFSVSAAKVQKLGVQSEAAAMRELGASLRLNARIETDEQLLYTIAPKFEGWVETLHVNTTGQSVRKGEALFEVYSPELVSALRELELAKQGLSSLKEADAEAQQSMQRLVDASAARLKNWDIAGAQLQGDRITYYAPANGIVLEKKAIAGMRFMPGETLYRIADLSTLWAIADVPEQDIGKLRRGDTAQVTVEAYPGRTFEGKVDFIYPTLNEITRTGKVRIVLRNANGALKPSMYAHAQITVGKAAKVLTVPTSAVIDSGTQQTVLLRLDEGRFAPRVVTLGQRSDNYVEVTDGLTEGEQVVTRANFLLDSESNLQAAFSGMGDTPTPQKARTVGHGATGVLEEDYGDGNVSITHEPIPSLKWPSMTMDFALANPSLAANLKPGSAIEFEIVERGQGEWVITKLQAQHEGH